MNLLVGWVLRTSLIFLFGGDNMSGISYNKITKLS